jgi:hypothetical protein
MTPAARAGNKNSPHYVATVTLHAVIFGNTTYGGLCSHLSHNVVNGRRWHLASIDALDKSVTEMHASHTQLPLLYQKYLEVAGNLESVAARLNCGSPG